MGTDAGRFATTEWSVVLQARDGDVAAAREALAELCRQYWFPVYAFFRRKSGSAEQAEDLTQGFFAHLIEADALSHVSRERGRFRSFLLACGKNFLLNEQARAMADKRGGGRAPISLEAVDADRRYRLEPANQLTPESLFDRQWALAVLAGALDELEAEASDPRLFARLKPMLTAADDGPRYAVIATELGMTEAAVKKAAQRLRQRYGEVLRARIAATVADPADVDDEIRGLFAALKKS